MGVVQQFVAFIVFIVRALGGLVRSLLSGGARRPRAREQPRELVMAETREGPVAAGAAPDGAAMTAPPTAPTLVSHNPPTNAELEAVIHHLPRPTIWPAVIAFGVALLGFGAMSSLTFAICGAVILLIGVGGWIVELRHA